MGIINVTPVQTGLVGVLPSVAYINTTDTIAEVVTTGYLNKEVANGLQISLPCIAAVSTVASPGAAPVVGWFQVSHSGTNWSLVAPSGTATVTLPTVANQLPIFTDTIGTMADSGVLYTSLILNSSTGGQSIASTTASATPGTVRSLKGLMTGSATTMTSGNLVGVRGEVDYVGASGGFLYGVQGKIIPTGTVSGSSWNAGVFGQLDISAATINAGQMAPIWGDYGATSHTLTNQTGLYGIAMTNTTAAVLAGQLYLYGGATNLMLLNTNAGLSGATYFVAAGTSAGSAGDTSKCNATEVLTISVNGTTYYIPLFAQNS